MKLETTYEEACEHFPAEVRQVLEKQKLSTSMHKDASPKELDWYYEWCVTIQGISLMERLTTAPEPEPARLSLDATLAEFERSMSADRETNGAVFMGVSARKGRAYWASEGRLSTLPPSVRTFIENSYNEETAEKERLTSLTPKQREQEVEALLGKLRGPGFLEIRDGKVIR